MSTWKGTLQHEDMGAGVWTLRTEDGETLTLDGDVPAGWVGQRVEVEGKKSGALGFGMLGGTVVKVSAVRRS